MENQNNRQPKPSMAVKMAAVFCGIFLVIFFIATFVALPWALFKWIAIVSFFTSVGLTAACIGRVNPPSNDDDKD